jgi:hypothetical protein
VGGTPNWCNSQTGRTAGTVGGTYGRGNGWARGREDPVTCLTQGEHGQSLGGGTQTLAEGTHSKSAISSGKLYEIQ